MTFWFRVLQVRFHDVMYASWYRNHPTHDRQQLDLARSQCLEDGELTFIGFMSAHQASRMLYGPFALSDTVATARKNLQFVKSTSNINSSQLISMYIANAEMLQ